jgi:hypothetical protein
MIDVVLTFVPPGGGEADYHRTYRLPALPRQGDYLSIMTKEPDGKPGTLDFIVRRVWWELKEPGNVENRGDVGTVRIECEFARGPWSSPSHQKSCDMYDGRATDRGSQPVPQFQASCY